MIKSVVISLLAVLVLQLSHTSNGLGQAMQTPEQFFGFMPGSDRQLFDYEQLIGYLHQLDQSSPRLLMQEVGKSPMGKPMYIAFISSAANIENLGRLREINTQLAMNGSLTNAQREELVRDGKVFVLATLSMHSSEVGPSQAAPSIAYDLVTANHPDTLNWLDHVVLMMIPSHNPDGMDKVVNNYKKYLGTRYEGSSLPEVYHKYVGHDNNRDFIILSQEDTKAIARIYNTDWFPQVLVEKHQMGSSGVRYFVPPPHDPIAENVDAGIWNWIGIFGSNLMKDMTKAGLKGVSQHYLFDDYWPGSTETCIWKNVIGFLTEGASVHTATPVFVEENELDVIGKGLGEYKKSINMPDPWPGGWWRLSDLVQYEVVSTMSILNTASANREAILQFRNDLCRREIEKGKTQAPYYYLLPLKQHDPGELAGLVNLLMEHGVKVYQTNQELNIDYVIIPKGNLVVPLAQPYRAFIKEVLEKQKFPERHYTPNGEMIKPYDIASWSLPLHRGVTAVELNKPVEGIEAMLVPVVAPLSFEKHILETYWAAIFSLNNNESYQAAFLAKERGLDVARVPTGDFIIFRDNDKPAKLDQLINELSVMPSILEREADFQISSFTIPRIALVETNMHDMDAGWTRFIFDSYHIPYTVVEPGDFEKTDFSKDFDVVVFPSNNKSILMEGLYKSESGSYPTDYPPEFTKGIGKKGMEKLLEFLEKGGIILSWGQSTELFTDLLTVKSGDTTESFRLPVQDISKQVQNDGVYCPGSLMRVSLAQGHPLTLGMEQSAGVFFRGGPVFETDIPHFDMDRRVIAKFPEEGILLSGYCEKPEKLANKTVLVWLRKGKGQVVLYGFNPQFRASTQGTYKLLFNGLLLERIK
ncbi:MAG: M14 family metallopeptidase [bacterium]